MPRYWQIKIPLPPTGIPYAFVYWADFTGKAAGFVSGTIYLWILLTWATTQGLPSDDPRYTVLLNALRSSTTSWLIWNYRLASVSLTTCMAVQAVQVFTPYTSPFRIWRQTAEAEEEEGSEDEEDEDEHEVITSKAAS